MSNIFDYQPGTRFIRLYRSKFKCKDDFEDLLKFLDLPLDCGILDIDVDAQKITVDGKTYCQRSYSAR